MNDVTLIFKWVDSHRFLLDYLESKRETGRHEDTAGLEFENLQPLKQIDWV